MKIVEVNRENFNEEVLKNKKKVLVDFYADWCGPCRMIKPIIEEIAENNDDVKIVSINIENEGELAEKYSISSIPCLVIFENGEEIKRSIGLISKNNIEKMIGE
ncbi:thioredoxin [Candidatus Saccharibacteria bacterium]|nr:thioredoxin [Candidatus Saccharibacteria bacterium]